MNSLLCLLWISIIFVFVFFPLDILMFNKFNDSIEVSVFAKNIFNLNDVKCCSPVVFVE